MCVALAASTRNTGKNSRVILSLCVWRALCIAATFVSLSGQDFSSSPCLLQSGWCLPLSTHCVAIKVSGAERKSCCVLDRREPPLLFTAASLSLSLSRALCSTDTAVANFHLSKSAMFPAPPLQTRTHIRRVVVFVGKLSLALENFYPRPTSNMRCFVDQSQFFGPYAKF